MSLNELGITLGFLFAYIVNYILMNVAGGWRIMFGLSSGKYNCELGEVLSYYCLINIDRLNWTTKAVGGGVKLREILGSSAFLEREILATGMPGYFGIAEKRSFVLSFFQSNEIK